MTTKLSVSDKFRLFQIIDQCVAVGIDAMIIEDSDELQQVRGRGKLGSHFLLSEINVPKINGILGLRRLNEVKARINAMGSFGDFDVEIEKNDSGEVAKILMKGKKSKTDFRATKPLLVGECVSSLDDDERYTIDLKMDEVSAITRVVKAMNAALVEFSVVNGVFSIAAQDETNNSFEVDFDSVPNFIDDSDCTFRFPSKNLLSILKVASAGKDQNREDDFVTLSLTENGILQIYAYDLRFILTQQVSLDDDGGDFF